MVAAVLGVLAVKVHFVYRIYMDPGSFEPEPVEKKGGVGKKEK